MKRRTFQERRQIQNRWWLGVGLFVLLGFVAAMRYQGPTPIHASAPFELVSAHRALVEIRNLLGPGQRKHAAGSADNIALRERLVQRLQQLGLETQELPFESQVGPLTNVLARRPGNPTSKPLLVVSHFDSCGFGPGVGDDLSSVGAILETIRAIQYANRDPKIELWFLFTDGEELGLLGAKAFVEQQNPFRQVKPLVLNFDARGNSGSSLMFETHRGNYALVRTLRHALGSPRFSNSLMISVKEQLPNDTDFTIFKRDGCQGLNFAMVGGAENYHTPEDSVDGLSLATLQHISDHLLGLLNAISNWKERQWSETDSEFSAVFFDVMGGPIVLYPVFWNPFLTVLCWGLFLAATILAFRIERIQPVYLFTLFTTLLGFVLFSACFGYGISWLLVKGEVVDRPFVPYGSMIAIVYWLVPVMMAYTLGGFVFGRCSPQHARLTLLFWLSGFSTLATIGMPGAAFVFHWPAIFLGIMMLFPTKQRWPDLYLTLFASILYTPLIVLFLDAIGPTGGFMLGGVFSLFTIPLLLLLAEPPMVVDFLKKEELDELE